PPRFTRGVRVAPHTSRWISDPGSDRRCCGGGGLVDLERARREPITVSATLVERRPILGGSRTRTIEVALAPDGR
ncbi:hypothetical protein, partial [Microbacterium allomyrinae]